MCRCCLVSSYGCYYAAVDLYRHRGARLFDFFCKISSERQLPERRASSGLAEYGQLQGDKAG